MLTPTMRARRAERAASVGSLNVGATQTGPGQWTIPEVVIDASSPQPTGGAVLSNGASMREAQTRVAAWMRLNPPVTPAGFGASASDFDGIFGPRTRAALRQFQVATFQDRTDGQLDSLTLKALRYAAPQATTGPAPVVVVSPTPAPTPKPGPTPGPTPHGLVSWTDPTTWGAAQWGAAGVGAAAIAVGGVMLARKLRERRELAEGYDGYSDGEEGAYS